MMNIQKRNRITFFALAAAFAALGLLAPALWAQPDMTGKRVKGFTFPDYNDGGDLLWRLKGDAWFETNEKVKLTNVQLETFEAAKQRLRMATPACTFDRARKNAESEQALTITAEFFVIEGEGFAWDGDAGRLVIRHNARFTMTNARQHLRQMQQGGDGARPGGKKQP